MKPTYYSLITVLFIILGISCSSDENPPEILERNGLLLNKYEFSDGEVNLEYTSNLSIQKLEYNHLIADPYLDKTIFYNYNSDNTIRSQIANAAQSSGQSTNYTYSSGTISEISLRDGYADAADVNILIFSDQLNYTQTDYFDDIEYNLLASYEISITLDNEGHISSLVRINSETQEESVFTFKFENNNLTRIVDPENNIFEIVYDNYNSFHTYPSGFGGGWNDVTDVAGLLYLDPDLSQKLRHIPYLFDHINSNNPVQYKLNGSIYRDFEYLYNQNGYPIRLITTGQDIKLKYY